MKTYILAGLLVLTSAQEVLINDQEPAVITHDPLDREEYEEASNRKQWSIRGWDVEKADSDDGTFHIEVDEPNINWANNYWMNFDKKLVHNKNFEEVGWKAWTTDRN